MTKMDNNNNNNNNTEGFEVALEEAPPTILHDAAAGDIEQELPIANDDYDEHVVVNYHATNKYLAGAAFVAVVGATALFNVGMGAGSGITRRFFGDSNASSSVSSASNVAFTASTNGVVAAKSAKAKATKSSATKSGKSVTTTTTSTSTSTTPQVTTTTSTTPATTTTTSSTTTSTSTSTTPQATTTTSTTPATTTTTSCPTEIVTSLSNLSVAIPDGAVGLTDTAFVTLPVMLNAGCGCIVDNVAIDIGINHPNVNDLAMFLRSPFPYFDVVTLVDQPSSSANLVAGNKITFDDSGVELDPLTLGANADGSGNIPTGTYNARGDGTGVYPNAAGLGKFNGDPAAGDWLFNVVDFRSGNAGTIVSVELTITCE